MEHTIHTPPVPDIQIDIWAQLNPTDYVEPPDPIPMVLENVIQAAGGRKEPTTDAENTEEDGQTNTEDDCETTNTCSENDIGTNLVSGDLMGNGNNEDQEEEPANEP